MIASCAPIPGPPSLARDLLASTDCLIGSRIESAYASLLAPGGVFSGAVTALLIIYVALLGWRLMLGLSSLSLGEMVPHVLRIGIVVALVSSWASYQQLVITLLFNGPEQIGNVLVRQASGSARLADGGLWPALQSVFDALTAYASDAWEQASSIAPVAPAAPAAAPVAAAAQLPPNPAAMMAVRFQPGAPQFAAVALWLAALLMMAASVGILLVARIILAILLILGPIFILMGLFNASRGLAEGWLRLTLRFALVPLFTLPLTAVLVAILLPMVDRLLETPAANVRDGPVLPIFLTVLVFAAVLLQALKLAGGIAGGLRLPQWATGRAPQPADTAAAPMPAANTPAMASRTVMAATTAGRAAAGRSGGDIAISLTSPRLVTSVTTAAPAPLAVGSRLGQQYRRLDLGKSPGRPA